MVSGSCTRLRKLQLRADLEKKVDKVHLTLEEEASTFPYKSTD